MCSTCGSKQESKASAFRYVKDILVGDVISESKDLSADMLVSQLKSQGSLFGTVKQVSASTDESKGLLIVDISQLFLDKNLVTDLQTDLVKVRMSLAAPSNLSIKKDVLLKGIIWEKHVILDRKIENFEKKLQDTIGQIMSDLNQKFHEQNVVPTFYI